MNRNTDRKSALLIGLIEAVIVSLAFISISVYLSYDSYSGCYLYECEAKASFEFDIVDSDGNIYPAGTELEVLYIDRNGWLTIGKKIDRETQEELFKNMLDTYGDISLPDRIRINPTADLKIEDAENSGELALVFESLKNDAKKDFWLSCLKTVGISLLVCAVSCALFVPVNFALKNKPKARAVLLVVIGIICVVFSIGSIMYLSRAL